jgi:Domain of unknown function (DUF4129)
MNNSAARKRHRAGALTMDLIEEAVGLLRQVPFAAHLAYYLGAIPFWIAMLYFISDMTRNAYAAERLADASLGMALIYAWKKCWQTVYAARLRAALAGRPDEPWTRRRILRMIAAQASIQPWGLILRPIAANILLPFVWVSSFFQSVTIVGDGSEAEGSVVSRAWSQAKLWPRQAHGTVLTISLFSLFVFLNVCIVLGVLPMLTKMFFAVDTAYTRGMSFYFNTTFLTATIALTSLAVDPLRKAVYVIRCFRGSSLESGTDLSADLSRIRLRPALASLLAVGLLLILPSSRAEAPVEAPRTADASELDRRISDVLSRREFAWRAPREKVARPSREQLSWLQRWMDDAGKSFDRWMTATGRQIGRVAKWVGNLFNFKPPSVTPPSPGSLDWVGLGKALLVILGGALIVLIGWLCVRLWQQRRPRAVLGQAAAVSVPDLRSEDIVASQLPEDGWIALARDHAARGELTLALRAAWLASLAHLGHREFIVILRHKTNRDYERELRRRARDRESLLSAFDQNLSSFESSWYGNHEVTRERFDRFEINREQIRQS